MRGIGRIVAAVLLAGGVAGAAAFAHLLGSVPAPGQYAFGNLPAAPNSPLIVRAAPLKNRPAAITRPAAHSRLTAPAHRSVQPVTVAQTRVPAVPTSEPTIAKGMRSTPVTPTPEPATPSATQPATAPAATPAPVAAPAAPPALADRSLTQAAPVVVSTASTVTTVSTVATAPKHQGDSEHGRSRSHDHSGDHSAATDLTTLSTTPVTTPVATPAPVVAPPATDTPSNGQAPGDSSDHSHAHQDDHSGDQHGDRHDDAGDHHAH